MINPFRHRKILKHGDPGRARVVASSPPNRGSTSFNMAMTLQVQVGDLPAYEVEDQWMVKAKDTEALGLPTIPVKVDREHPDRVAIDWEQLRGEQERAVRERREALAAGGVTFGSAADAEAIADQIGAALQSSFGAQGFEVRVGEPPDADDTVSRLERLAVLRDSGAITPEEFEQAKRQILDG